MEGNNVWLWVLAALMVLGGLAGAVLPALPGVPLVFGGLVVAAWADDFQRVGWITLTFLGVLTVASFVIDFAATAMGAKRVGASRLAIIGAALGAFGGIFLGIPGLILGADITPRRDTRIASQIDLPVTLLSLIGIADATPMTGRDLSDPHLALPARAFMQYDHNFAYMQDDTVVVLQPDKPASQYRHDAASGRLLPTPLSPALASVAHAHALWGTLAYDNGWHRLPTP